MARKHPRHYGHMDCATADSFLAVIGELEEERAMIHRTLEFLIADVKKLAPDHVQWRAKLGRDGVRYVPLEELARNATTDGEVSEHG